MKFYYALLSAMLEREWIWGF